MKKKHPSIVWWKSLLVQILESVPPQEEAEPMNALQQENQQLRQQLQAFHGKSITLEGGNLSLSGGNSNIFLIFSPWGNDPNFSQIGVETTNQI